MHRPRLTGAALATTAVVAVGTWSGVSAHAADAPTASAAAKSTITMSGSTSVAPLARQLAKGYLKAFPGSVRFKLLEGGSDVGINDVSRGRVTIGNSSRDPQSSDPDGLAFNRIARDGVCIVTHPDNPLGNLSQEQVQQIFSGKVRNWSDVPGASVSGTIDLNVRTQASGTQDAFQNIFMGGPSGPRPATSASQKASNGLVQTAVRSNKNAIGYVDFKFTEGTNAVSYKGVACNLRNAKAGTYPGVRSFWMVTRGTAKGATAKFIKWTRTSSAANKIISSNWVALN
ncbi:MAG: phosphate ABC transporter substrate-binding protein [Solirubrobacteraceae bacterium]|nr:phosphate ABC transporter substrate-binding protein [Solirubrobacteraceae bacterium]